MKDFVRVKITGTQRKVDANKKKAQVYEQPHSAGRGHLAGYVFGSSIVLEKGTVFPCTIILNLDCEV